MLGKRALTVKVEKQEKTKDDKTIVDDHSFERKTYITVRALENLGAKMFLGVCVYILLDTHRQVKIAEASNRSNY